MTASLPPNLDRELVAFVRARGIGQLKHFDRGRLLHWQGDPVDTVDIVADGVVKLSPVSVDGRVRTSRLPGRGAVLRREGYLWKEGRRPFIGRRLASRRHSGVFAAVTYGQSGGRTNSHASSATFASNPRADG